MSKTNDLVTACGLLSRFNLLSSLIEKAGGPQKDAYKKELHAVHKQLSELVASSPALKKFQVPSLPTDQSNG